MRFAQLPLSLPRVLGAWALLLPGVIAFQPTFGGLRGYLAAFVAVTVGAGLALLAERFRWGAVSWFGALVLSYLLLGGPLVLPGDALFGFIPTLRTLGGLSLLTFSSWNDLLTAATPAGDIPGPAAVPLIAGLIASTLFVGIIRRTTAVFWPLSIPVAWLGFSIAFGVRTAPTAVWLGAALGTGILVWLTAHRLAATRIANTQILLRKEQGLSRTTSKAVSAGLVILLAGVLAIGFNILTSERVNRQVLRDNIEPPLNLNELTSPLMSFRLFEQDLKEEVLFRVENMPADTRFRLAVMDTYDGNVFNVSQHTNQYLKVGRELPWHPEGEVAQVTVTVGKYEDVWVPSFGFSSRVEFSGQRAKEQARGLFFNRESHQLLTTASLDEGTTITLWGIPQPELEPTARERITSAGVGKAPFATASRVPDALVRNSSEWTADATSAYEQLELMADKLVTEGYFSDGSDGKARSGHTNERLSKMFEAPQWIGDDEQYAAALTLMATQLGVPVRVVMGFYPDPEKDTGAVWEVTGEHAHVWVEANLDGAGWVSFDPTPDQTPQTEVPKPKPKPKPLVEPPPDPPEKLPEEPIVADKDAVEVDDEKDRNYRWLVYLARVGMVLGGGALVASPFLVVIGLKKRRTARRRTFGEPADQISGAWDEVVDQARDMGYVAPSSRTRREGAAGLQMAYPNVPVALLAHRVDASIFGPGIPTESQSDVAWTETQDLKSALLATLPWHRRTRAIFSTKSLRRRRTEAALETRLPLLSATDWRSKMSLIRKKES